MKFCQGMEMADLKLDLNGQDHQVKTCFSVSFCSLSWNVDMINGHMGQVGQRSCGSRSA